MPEAKIEQVIYRWRVRAGLLGGILALAFSRPSQVSVPAGFLISFTGLVIRAWAAGHIYKEKRLTMSGPYSYSRNPLYFGNLIIGIGVTAGANSWIVLLISVLYFGLFYPVIINRERRRMRELFAKEYEEYRKKVPLFWPSLKPLMTSYSRFRWKTYFSNREYRALLGTLIFWLFLILKMSLLR